MRRGGIADVVARRSMTTSHGLWIHNDKRPALGGPATSTARRAHRLGGSGDGAPLTSYSLFSLGFAGHTTEELTLTTFMQYVATKLQ